LFAVLIHPRYLHEELRQWRANTERRRGAAVHINVANRMRRKLRPRTTKKWWISVCGCTDGKVRLRELKDPREQGACLARFGPLLSRPATRAESAAYRGPKTKAHYIFLHWTCLLRYIFENLGETRMKQSAVVQRALLESTTRTLKYKRNRPLADLAEPGSLMNAASKLWPHTQTGRGTCPGVGL
jgi:hypothetical protein